ncbi:MAG: amidohydrolase family protein [Oscillospiraceae bacterium]|jgi:predicted TIM-barrel fold metal-dependent hydrolase|nr:amidohydrolase family protein [Oscillospiraceae bacterium]
MVIDFHTHVFPDAIAAGTIRALEESINHVFVPVTDGTLAGLVGHMDKSGVDISVIQPVVTKPSQTRGVNEWSAAAQSDRIVAFGGVHPRGDDYRRDIDYAVELGLRGLKFHAEYQGFDADDVHMLRIYDYALSRGLILLHHAGADPAYRPPFRSSPRQFANIADAMKGGVIVAAHFGGHDQWDDVERYLAGRDIYLDTSMGFDYFSMEQFVRITRAHGADKVLFATDSPWSDAGRELERLRTAPLTEAEKELILGANAARLLKIGK